MPLRLTVFLPNRPGVEQCLDDGRTYRLGRDTGVDIVVDDARVSREHLLIEGTRPGWRIRDLGSKNGLRVDGRPAADAALDGRRWLSIGGVPALSEAVGECGIRGVAASRRSAAVMGLAGVGSRDALVGRVLTTFCEVSECERAGLWRMSEHGTLACVRLLGPPEPPPSLAVIAGVIESGRPVFCSDTTGAGALAAHASIAGGGLRALVALPVDAGVLYADSRIAGRTFTEYDADLLGGIAAQLAVSLAALRIHAAAR